MHEDVKKVLIDELVIEKRLVGPVCRLNPVRIREGTGPPFVARSDGRQDSVARSLDGRVDRCPTDVRSAEDPPANVRLFHVLLPGLVRTLLATVDLRPEREIDPAALPVG